MATTDPFVDHYIERAEDFAKPILSHLRKLVARTFDAFPYSKNKDYAEWIAGAKSDATRNKRLSTATDGRPRVNRIIGDTKNARRVSLARTFR